ncbi:MAG: hypothetical protein WCP22_11940 [Chlamydiota bacterium]
MHRTILIIAAAILGVPASPRADERPKYPFKTAVVTYRISGSIQEGTQVLTIDDYGRKTRTERDTTLTLMGKKQKESIVEIDDGESLYRIDLVKKTGEKTPSFSRVAREMVQSMSPAQKKTLDDIGKELAKGRAAAGIVKQAGKGKVLGRECDVYEAMGMKSWLWNNLPLKKESPSLGAMVQEAVEINLDLPIPPEKFKPPLGVTITDATRGGEDPESAVAP